MPTLLPFPRRLRRALATVALVLTAAVAACSGNPSRIAPPGADPDKFLFERGTELLGDRKWLSSREYFRQITDNYPQSPYRADAKLGLGDTFLGEGTTEAYLQAINEYREFLSFYPTHARADYAQYKTALVHFAQMRSADRDQTATREALTELEAFVERYPNSSLMGEAREKLRQVKDRLGESEYRVGLFYFRAKWYPGAIDRFKSLLQRDPEYAGRDAVLFYLSEALLLTPDRKAEALPYYEQLLKEFQASQYLEAAYKRIVELRGNDKPPATVER